MVVAFPDLTNLHKTKILSTFIIVCVKNNLAVSISASAKMQNMKHLHQNISYIYGILTLIFDSKAIF